MRAEWTSCPARDPRPQHGCGPDREGEGEPSERWAQPGAPGSEHSEAPPSRPVTGTFPPPPRCPGRWLGPAAGHQGLSTPGGSPCVGFRGPPSFGRFCLSPWPGRSQMPAAPGHAALGTGTRASVCLLEPEPGDLGGLHSHRGPHTQVDAEGYTWLGAQEHALLKSRRMQAPQAPRPRSENHPP